jgi:hypothetical protein
MHPLDIFLARFGDFHAFACVDSNNDRAQRSEPILVICQTGASLTIAIATAASLNVGLRIITGGE